MQQTAKIISLPEENLNNFSKTKKLSKNKSDIHDAAVDELVERLAQDTSLEEMISRQKKCLSEIMLLRSENKWQEIVDLFYPLEEKESELIPFSLDLPIRSELAFSLGQLKRFNEAIKEYKICLQIDPKNFKYHSGLAYTMYNYLFSARNKELILSPKEKKELIKNTHKHLSIAQSIKPEGVTCYYREAMLYKKIQNKPEKAIPLFQTAIKNWENYNKNQKKVRHQEFKNYIKSIYNLSSCKSLKREYIQAFNLIEKCIARDQDKDYISKKHKYFALGKIQFHMGKLEDARKTLEFAANFIKSEQEDDYIFELLARTYLRLNEPQKALQIISRIPKKSRRHYVVWTLSDILIALGNLDEAKKQLLSSASRDRKSAHKAYIRLCKIYFREKDYQISLKYAKNADSFHLNTYTTHDPEALFWIAVIYEKLNNKLEAINTLKELETSRPNYPLLPRLRQLLDSFI